MNVQDAALFCEMPSTWVYQTLQRIDETYHVRQHNGVTHEMLGKLMEWKIRATGIDRFPYERFVKPAYLDELERYNFSTVLRKDITDVELADYVIAYKVWKKQPIANILTFVSRYRGSITEYRCWFGGYIRKSYVLCLLSGDLSILQKHYTAEVLNYLATVEF